MSLHVHKLKKNDWTSLLKKIIQKLVGWKGRFLSIVGRIMLLNTIIMLIVIFWASNFILPIKVIKKINKL